MTSKRPISKFHKPVPKFMWGGILSQGASMGGAMLDKQREPSNDMMTYGGTQAQSILANQQKANQGGQAVEGIVSNFGPIGMAIGGISKLAGKAFGQNEFGEYTGSKFGAKSKEFFNRSLNMKEGVAGLMDTFKRPTADNIKSQLTLGLWGKDSRQKDAAKLRRAMEINKMNEKFISAEQNNAMVSHPKYQAPAYGRLGLKLSKFSKPY
jgi:hypothetical protein